MHTLRIIFDTSGHYFPWIAMTTMQLRKVTSGGAVFIAGF